MTDTTCFCELGHECLDCARRRTARRSEVPQHMRPESCYVCGGTEHADGTPRGGHKFWSNADARAEYVRDYRPE